MDVFKHHQVAIAIRTLRMSDAGVLIVGGMGKADARVVLASVGWGPRRIATLEAE